MRQDESGDEKGFEQFERFLEDWSRRDFLRRMGATAAWTAFSGGMLEFLAACGGSTTPVGVTPKRGGHIIEGNFSDIRTLNSMLSSDTASNQLIGLMFDGLLNVKKNGDLIGALAKDVPITSADGLTYTFKLRPNLKWSDGQPITADDVIFTYELAYDPKYADVSSPRRGDLSKYIASVTAPDPQTVVIKTTQVFAPFLGSHGSYGILPKHILGNMTSKEINTADFNSGPSVTNGPFKFIKWDKGQQVTLARNDNYWAGPPYLDQYVYKVLPDSVAVTTQLKTGEIDIGPVDPSQFDSVKTAANVTMTEFPTPTFTFYAYNLDPAKLGGELFSDKAVRQALLYALDRQKIVDAVFFKHGVVANGVEPPTSWAYKDKPQVIYTFDKAKAMSLLDGAGWTVGSDGTRAKGGVKLKFNMITNAGNKQRESMLTVMQQSWKDIGVDATPQLIQFPQLVSQIVSIRTFDVFLVGFNWSIDPDEAPLFHSRNTVAGGFNGADFKNTDVDNLLDQAIVTLDRAKRKSLYFQFQDIMSDQVPSPIILFNTGIWGVSQRVMGTDFGPFNQFGARPWMKDVWVTDGK
ncbi:MAG TPA: ABC transporter substrate-binding protein [Candidatus Dormibacteraeota bacterium]|nr:ABC transporter substrate-binding protein [Candidatus Dormibacteraeota bacterium]